MTPTKNKKYVLGIDVGGSKVEAQLLEVLGSGLAEAPAWESSAATQKGKAQNFKQITDVIRAASAKVEELGGELIAAGIGSPGRFTPEGIIMPGSAQNMGLTPDEFDNVNLAQSYAAELSGEAQSSASCP